MVKIQLSMPRIATMPEVISQNVTSQMNRSAQELHTCSNKTHEKLHDEPENNPDFATIRLISRIVLFVLKKCWITCGASIIVVFVMYWYFGGIMALFLLAFAFSALLYQVSDWLLYHPDQPPHSRIYVPPASMFGLPAESVHIRTKDGVNLHALLVKQDPSIFNLAPTLLLLHGNAGNIGHRMPVVRGFYHTCGCNVLLLEYRGYGHSEGSPCEEGLYLDAQAGLQWLVQHPELDHSKLIVYGQSLGGAVAIDLASRPEQAANIMLLVVENTFTSLPEVAKVLFNWKFIHCLPTWCYKNQFRSLSKIDKVTVPSLFISGSCDNLIPPAMMERLYQSSAGQLKRLIVFESGTHNETWQCNGYYRALSLFINDVIVASHQNKSWPKQEVCLHIPADVL